VERNEVTGAAASARQAGMYTIEVDGQVLRVAIRHGAGDCTPLVLMNGIGVRLELFQPLIEALNPAHEINRFDAPGVGGSPLPAVPYCFPSLAKLVAHMLDHWATRRWTSSVSHRAARWRSSSLCSTPAAVAA
jgi:pimeloyl-ACP methyl ester carboxylesterase